MKTILVLLDGLGDRPYEVLNYRTPLEAASTMNLDRLASLGSNGLFHAALPGQCLPSETAHYLLLGYDLESFPGRGLLEAVGEDVPFGDTDVLCLTHLCSVDWKEDVPILVQGRDEIEASRTDMERLFAAITHYGTHGIRFRLYQTHRNDAVLILSGEASPHVSDSDPMVAGRAMALIYSLSGNPEPARADRTARALNEYLTYCHRVLINHEINRLRRKAKLHQINFLATHRCGRRIPQEPFYQRWGLSGMLIASGSLYGGIAQELGLAFMPVKDGRDPGEDLRERVHLALVNKSHNFVLVHTKVPDEAAHTGDPRRKEAAIAALDSGLDELVRVVESGESLLVVITADHSTPSISTLIHSGEPVPITLVGRTVRRDGVAAFNEVRAATGCLGLLRGKELMLTILNHMDRSALLGHRLGRIERPYHHQAYEPFKLSD